MKRLSKSKKQILEFVHIVTRISTANEPTLTPLILDGKNTCHAHYIYKEMAPKVFSQQEVA